MELFIIEYCRGQENQYFSCLPKMLLILVIYILL